MIRLSKHFAANGRFNDVIDAKKILLAAKKQKQVYLTTDTHWTEDGFQVVYQQIIERLRLFFPDIQPLTLQTERKNLRTISGDLAVMMNLRSVLTEKISSHIWTDSCDVLAEEFYSKNHRIW